MNETIEDIVEDMRNYAQRHWMRDEGQEIDSFADRIDEACHQPVTDCNVLGNAAKMRVALDKADKALTRISKSAWFMDSNLGETIEVMEAGKAITTAISAPPRNCDIMDWRAAWTKWRTEIHTQKPCGYSEVVSGTEQFMDWYMSEAKGSAK